MLRRRRRLACAGAMLVLLALLSSLAAAPALAALPGANGGILFGRFVPSTPSQPGLWTVDPDGQNEAHLLPDAAIPAWSPSGTQIAFTRGSGLWVAEADGSNPHRVTTPPTTSTPSQDIEPTWSPDGTRIAFVRYQLNVRSAIWVVTLKGGNLKQLTVGKMGQGSGQTEEPSWSPDGSKIAFHTRNTHDQGLWTMNSDGSNETPFDLVGTNWNGTSPDWSPDGTQIAFVAGGWIGVVDADGENFHFLNFLDTRGSGHDPAWSPDGTEVAFTDFPASAPSGGFCCLGLWAVGSDGNNLRSLTDTADTTAYTAGTTDCCPAWQPLAVTRTPWSIAFGSRPDSTESGAQTVTVTNGRRADLRLDTVTLTGPDATSFRVIPRLDKCSGAVVAPGGICTVGARFLPDGVGPKAATLNLSNDSPDTPLSVALTGTGTPGPSLTIAPEGLKYGRVAVATTSPVQTVTFTNTGSAAMNITQIAVDGANANDFVDLSETCTTLTSLRPDRSCTAKVAFRPTATGPRAARLTIADTAPGNPHHVALSGTGR